MPPTCGRAWIGFNLSHSLGALLVGAMAIAWPALAAGHAALAWLPAAVAAVYLLIGLRYWFHVPNAGIAVATLGLRGSRPQFNCVTNLVLR